MQPLIQKLWERLEPFLHENGYDLVEVERGTQGRAMLIRLYVDYAVPQRQGITIDELAQLSPRVNERIDAEALVKEPYALEISSPGLDRPLRKLADFARFRGKTAKIALTTGLLGRRNFKGTLQGTEREEILVEENGTLLRLPHHDIKKANLIYDFSGQAG